MALRNYVNTSKEGQLSAPIGTGDTTIALTPPGLVNIPATPFYVRLDPDTASEEIILAGSGSSATSLQNCTRGFDGTTAFSHLAGAKARHCVAAEFYTKADVHVEATANVHGLSGGAAVVGTTQTQTLTNKTVNSSVIDVAHSTSPAGSQAVKVSANDATGRDGFVWDNTGGSSGRSLVVRSGGVDRFVVSGVGLVTSNSSTGTDKALSVQQSATERFFVQNDGTADFGLQTAGATGDRVTIRTRATQVPLRIRNDAAASVFSVGATGTVDASGTITTAANLSAAGTLAVTGTSTLTGDVSLPLPAAGITQRLVVNSRTGGTNFEGRNQAGVGTFYVRASGEIGTNDKAFIHNSGSPVVAKVNLTSDVPSPTANMVVWDHATTTWRRYDGSSWVELQPHLHARQAAAQSVPNNAFTTLTGLTEDLDTHAAFNATTGVFTVPTGFGGWYELGGGVGFDVNSTGQRGLRWVKNGSEINGSSSLLDAAAGGNATMVPSRTILVSCAAGDTLALQGIQNSGGSLNTTSAGSQQSTVYIKRLLNG